jgi:hypothetical protein
VLLIRARSEISSWTQPGVTIRLAWIELGHLEGGHRLAGQLT